MIEFNHGASDLASYACITELWTPKLRGDSRLVNTLIYRESDAPSFHEESMGSSQTLACVSLHLAVPDLYHL